METKPALKAVCVLGQTAGMFGYKSETDEKKKGLLMSPCFQKCNEKVFKNIVSQIVFSLLSW